MCLIRLRATIVVHLHRSNATCCCRKMPSAESLPPRMQLCSSLLAYHCQHGSSSCAASGLQHTAAR